MIARLLAARADVNQLAPGGTTALCLGRCWGAPSWLRYIAAQGQHAEAVARLLAGGAAVDLAVEGGGTALHVAAQNGHTEAVAWLLAGGAHVDVVMENGITPLFLAAQSGHVDVIVRLLAQGASVNLAASSGATPLHYAALHGHTETVARLLVARAEVNEVTRSGGTALHVAAQGGHTEAVAWLLAGRADVHQDRKGVLHCFTKMCLKHVAGDGGWVDCPLHGLLGWPLRGHRMASGQAGTTTLHDESMNYLLG